MEIRSGKTGISTHPSDFWVFNVGHDVSLRIISHYNTIRLKLKSPLQHSFETVPDVLLTLSSLSEKVELCEVKLSDTQDAVATKTRLKIDREYAHLALESTEYIKVHRHKQSYMSAPIWLEMFVLPLASWRALQLQLSDLVERLQELDNEKTVLRNCYSLVYSRLGKDGPNYTKALKSYRNDEMIASFVQEYHKTFEGNEPSSLDLGQLFLLTVTDKGLSQTAAVFSDVGLRAGQWLGFRSFHIGKNISIQLLLDNSYVCVDFLSPTQQTFRLSPNLFLKLSTWSENTKSIVLYDNGFEPDREYEMRKRLKKVKGRWSLISEYALRNHSLGQRSFTLTLGNMRALQVQFEAIEDQLQRLLSERPCINNCYSVVDIWKDNTVFSLQTTWDSVENLRLFVRKYNDMFPEQMPTALDLQTIFWLVLMDLKEMESD